MQSDCLTRSMAFSYHPGSFRAAELQLLHLLTAFVWQATRIEDHQAVFIIHLLMNWMCSVDEIASKNEEKKQGESGWKFHGRRWVERIRCKMFAIQSRNWPKRDEKKAVLAWEESICEGKTRRHKTRSDCFDHRNKHKSERFSSIYLLTIDNRCYR
jgi:hypothetical protein